MPRKKQQPQEGKAPKMRGYIAGAGEIVQQDISDTLRQNFMPYAMSVIMSRAIPEIDGFKPSHRKLLYTMYTMGLLGPTRTKSANIVGQTMKLNPHGDAAEEILTRANDEGADLIVMGTHGRKGIDRILFGSVAEKVVKNASMPVLTVRPTN